MRALNAAQAALLSRGATSQVCRGIWLDCQLFQHSTPVQVVEATSRLPYTANSSPKPGCFGMQLMPAGEASVLCSRSRDACRLALVVLPPAMPLAEPPAGAFGPPAPESSGTSAGPAGSAASPAPAADAVAANPPAMQQQQPAPPQQPISEIVSVEVAEALGAGSGAVIFVRPDLAELEALAQRLEKDETSALYGASQYHAHLGIAVHE